MESLIGKKMLGFKFDGSPGFTFSMKDLIGKEGEIVRHYPESCTVQFPAGGIWSYPYPEILNHLVEDARTIDELLTEMKQLISKL